MIFVIFRLKWPKFENETSRNLSLLWFLLDHALSKFKDFASFKIQKIIFRLIFGLFFNREIPEFSLLMIFIFFRLERLKFKNRNSQN